MRQHYADNLVLPWSKVSSESKRYWAIVLLLFILVLPVALIIPNIQLPEKERSQLEALPPQLAKVIIEKKKVEPKPKEEPEPPKKEEPEKKPEQVKEEPKPTPEPKPKPKPKPKPEIKKTPPKKVVEEARKVAESSGLLALQDDLADMRATLDTGSLTSTPNMVAKTIAASASAVDASSALRGSGGVDTTGMSVPAETVALAQREGTVLEENEVEKLTAEAKKKGNDRSSGNIRRVFDQNKSSLFTLYHRELRKDPSLEGKLVLKLTIEPSGVVSSCEVVSSDLNSSSLERKIVSRVKLFNFGAQSVASKTITYPIDFFQS
ncbi:AgmX/PglI C-terminal domain-containing protein [Alkalimarinus alittae]|uniref:AgmX/PglI C-terminal domain-containing protein n=1 Tax=Alkalimarinus alittae TaxID=2961619 RepID=A0ABY6N6R5_9ALTE|nr:AgmX/PglI C-terminal domain-containing protein [Alkalimarinus alittae]UZE97811.1 AgmX/PglI C-terminal domain-containing protein [Alkalimarinus alittae]